MKLAMKICCSLIALVMASPTISFASEYEDWKTSNSVTAEDAFKIGEKLGITWEPTGDGNYIAIDKGFDLEQFTEGMNVELEHGKRYKVTSVTYDNQLKTGKVALAHLNEFPDYYTRLEAMEVEAHEEWEAGNLQLPVVTDPAMDTVKTFTTEEAQAIGEQLGITWDKFDVEQFRAGMDIELEHGSVDKVTDVTHNDPLLTGKIALGHLVEFPDYYTRLYEMEEEAEA
ncbi:DUF5661 family protein [Methanolobus chelungpuianus]|uniref:DUF5661 family protein n=1 Tax=Methanolobus chelungpuianus TaxID=502115 RepID=UPI002114F0F7|nr:DUF5661 family protein [Methanolobus chelungpuianus]